MNAHVKHTATELWSNWEMLGPCLTLVAVSVLGAALGWGLDILFRR